MAATPGRLDVYDNRKADVVVNPIRDVGVEVDDDPEVIRAHIRETRSSMGETIDLIQEKLSPERLTEKVQHKIREATIGKVEDMADAATRNAKNWRSSLVRTVKENPIPSALVGLGLGWLLFQNNDDEFTEYAEEDYRYVPHGYDYQRAYYPDYPTAAETGLVEQAQNRVAETAEDVKDTVSETVSHTKEKVGELASQTQEKVDDLTHQAQQQARRLQYTTKRQMRQARRGFWQMMDDNPLAVGAVVLAAGAVVGLSLPKTQMEDEWMGEQRDRLVDQVQTTAKQTVEKVKDVAGEVQEAAAETVKDELKTRESPIRNPQ
jgi:gas vesicle protein